MATKVNHKAQKEFGEKIRHARVNGNFTQEEVAKAIGMKGNYYAKIERGEINTTFQNIYRVIKALKVKASDIFPD